MTSLFCITIGVLYLATLLFDNEDLARGIQIINNDRVSVLLKNGGKVRAVMQQEITILSEIVSQSGSERPVEIVRINNGLLKAICDSVCFGIRTSGWGTVNAFIEDLTVGEVRYRGKGPEIPSNRANIEITNKILTHILTLSAEPLVASLRSLDEDVGAGTHKRPLDEVVQNILSLVKNGLFGIMDLNETGTLTRICLDHGVSIQELKDRLKSAGEVLDRQHAKRQASSRDTGDVLGGLFAMSDRIVEGIFTMSENLFPAPRPSYEKPADTSLKMDPGYSKPIEAFEIKSDGRGSEVKRRCLATLVIPDERKETDRECGSRKIGGRSNEDRKVFHRMATRRMQDSEGSVSHACNRNPYSSGPRGNAIL